MLIPASCHTERFGAEQGHTYLADDPPPDRMAGRVQLAVVDLPSAAKTAVLWRSGAADWLNLRSSLRLNVYHNRNDGLEEYCARLRETLETAHNLLSDTGSVYVFAEQRTSAHIRLLLDDVFGRSNFLNEIIWAKEIGLRPAGHFTRSHDTIFLFKKGQKALFNPTAAGRRRGPVRSHLRRMLDAHGRAYYANRSGEREYRYYEDETVSLGDVWSDIPDLTPKDAERMGWEGQKPEALIARLLETSSRPGDTVAALNSCSGTVAAVAQRLGRQAFLFGSSTMEALFARRRLLLGGAESCTIHCPHANSMRLRADAELMGGKAVALRWYERSSQPTGTLLEDGLGSLEYWATGRADAGFFHVHAWAMRTRQQPTLPQELPIGPGAGQPCIALGDADGTLNYYLMM